MDKTVISKLKGKNKERFHELLRLGWSFPEPHEGKIIKKGILHVMDDKGEVIATIFLEKFAMASLPISEGFTAWSCAENISIEVCGCPCGSHWIADGDVPKEDLKIPSWRRLNSGRIVMLYQALITQYLHEMVINVPKCLKR